MEEDRRPHKAWAEGTVPLPVFFLTVIDYFRFLLIKLCSWILKKDFGRQVKFLR